MIYRTIFTVPYFIIFKYASNLKLKDIFSQKQEIVAAQSFKREFPTHVQYGATLVGLSIKQFFFYLETLKSNYIYYSQVLCFRALPGVRGNCCHGPGVLGFPVA